MAQFQPQTAQFRYGIPKLAGDSFKAGGSIKLDGMRKKDNDPRVHCRTRRDSLGAVDAGWTSRSRKAEGFPNRLLSEARVISRDTAASLNLQEIAGVLHLVEPGPGDMSLICHGTMPPKSGGE